MCRISTVSVLAAILGLTWLSAGDAGAGTLYDAQLAGWASERIGTGHGYFLPGVGPSTRGLEASRDGTSNTTCSTRFIATTNSYEQAGDRDTNVRSRCTRHLVDR